MHLSWLAVCVGKLCGLAATTAADARAPSNCACFTRVILNTSMLCCYTASNAILGFNNCMVGENAGPFDQAIVFVAHEKMSPTLPPKPRTNGWVLQRRSKPDPVRSRSSTLACTLSCKKKCYQYSTLVMPRAAEQLQDEVVGEGKRLALEILNCAGTVICQRTTAQCLDHAHRTIYTQCTPGDMN